MRNTMRNTFDLLANPDVFQARYRTRRASVSTRMSEPQMVKVALLQLKEARLEYQKTGFLGKLKNWVSNTINTGLAWVKGLKEKFVTTFYELLQEFIVDKPFIGLMTEGLQTSIVGKIAEGNYWSWWLGCIERKFKWDTNRDKDYRTGELISGWFETDEDRSTKEFTNTFTNEVFAFHYDSYLEGWLYYDDLIKNPDPRVQQSLEEQRGKKADPKHMKMPDSAMKSIRQSAREIVEKEVGVEVVSAVLKELNGLLNPLSLIPAMKDTWKQIMGEGSGGTLKALAAGTGALIMGLAYFAFKWILATLLGTQVVATVIGGGMVYTLLTKGTLVGVLKSVLAKKVAKKFGALWKSWFGGKKVEHHVVEGVNNLTSEKDIFVQDMQGEFLHLKDIKRHIKEHPELADNLQMPRSASRVASRYMALAH